MAKFSDSSIPDRSKMFQLVENYIETNLASQFSLHELADLSYTSYHNFQHQFTKHYEESPWSFVKHVRLEHAAGFLRHSDFSVRMISEMVGYNTNSSFCKAFSEHFNYGPRMFRRLNQLPVDNYAKYREIENLLPIKLNEFENHLEQGRFEYLPDIYFNFRRINHKRNTTDFDQVLKEFKQKDKLAHKGLIVTSPEIYCMRFNNWMTREDCGYFTSESEIDSAFDLQKKFSRCKYFVMPFNDDDLEMLSVFIYKLIDMTTRGGILKLKTHYSFVKINFIPSYSIEAWIPIV